MSSISTHQLIPVLQMAVGPVILISGVGLLLLSMTNRLGRAVDRARLLVEQLRRATSGDQPRLSAQLHKIFQRAKIIRVSIAMSALSVLFAAILIITLFLSALFQLETGLLIALLFIGCLLALIASLAAFLLDIQFALAALKLELERDLEI
jgi:hypothetical protein